MGYNPWGHRVKQLKLVVTLALMKMVNKFIVKIQNLYIK